jgi:hypothetical protein
LIVYDRFMTSAGPLIDEFAKQLDAAQSEIGRVLGKFVRSDRALPVPPARDRRVWSFESGSIDSTTIDEIIRDAEAERGTPWPIPLASAAVRVHRDGDRDSWEQVVFARQRRVSRAAIAAAVTLDAAWIDELVDGIVLICEQSTWCWPAHDDTFARHGSVLATVDDPFLDLGAGEIASQLAWVDYLLADALDEHYPGLRERMQYETRTRVLEPFLRRRDWHWLGLDGNIHNWNPWIHGNVLVAALRFSPDGDELGDIIGHVVEGIDRYVGALPADGAIDEGFGYWWNGACRAIEALDLLQFATDGRVDATEIPALVATVAFPHRMLVGGDWYVNFSDSQARPSTDLPWHVLHAAALAVHDDDAAAHALSYRSPGHPVARPSEGLGRLLRGLTNTEWRYAAPASPPLPVDSWWPSTEVLVTREHAGSALGLTLAVKGGHNGENHNHNDVGSFIVASDGTPVIIDAGRPTYTAATFGPDRYDIWTMQSTWHNLPEVRGHAQSLGREFTSRDVTVTTTQPVSSLALDLSGAYDMPALRSWTRSAALERTDSARVSITDNWSLDAWHGEADEPPTLIRLLLAGRVELDTGTARVTPLDGAPTVVLNWNPDSPATLTTKHIDDQMLSSVWGAAVHRLDLTVTALTTMTLTVHQELPKSEGRS